MKIDNSTKSIANGAIREERGRPLKSADGDTGTSPQSTRVQLSPLSAQLQSIQRGFADTPVIDAARVAELKDAISNGHFKVDADKVADRLLETVRELIAAHKR
ncbi:MAG: flagellar biosynthesis anti-sigma factor FlgM [Burkholderiales bacterium]